MSNRTLMEMNHDYAHRIEEKPGEFLELFGAVMRGFDREAAQELQQRFGLTIGRTRHHSTAMKPDVLAAFDGREP